VVGYRSVLASLGASALLLLGALDSAPLSAAMPPAADVKDVARNDTLVISGFSPGPSEIVDPQNMNPYSLGGLGRVRDVLNKTIFEFLFLYNHNTGEQIPWLASGYTAAPDGMSVDVTLRDGVEWSDGQPFTSDDVKYTIELLRDSPSLVFAADMKEWVKDVTVTDAQHFTINLNKPQVRFFYYYFVENSEINLPILPKHIWQGQDPATFSNFNLMNAGWPVGTGPYVLVDASGQAQIFDRNDNWWGARTGFQPLPRPLRVIFQQPGAVDTAAARMINDEFDIGPAMEPSIFEAARARNPNIVSWNSQGPVWGAADACVYILGLNTRWGPTADVHVRRAIEHAIDRTRLVDLAWEGATVPLVVPFSTYGGLGAYVSQMTSVIEKYNPDNPDPSQVAGEMLAAGYVQDAGGFWARDGTRLTMDLLTPGFVKSMGPTVERQLRDNGFDVRFKLFDPDLSPFFNLVRTGNASIWNMVHCGSSAEPWGTLQHFHSRFASPAQGQQNAYISANSQYMNPEFDAIIDQMDSIAPSPSDPTYVALASQATELFLRDIPEITLADHRSVVTFNTTYWRGWMSASDPYAAPSSLWAAMELALLKVQPAPGQ
jgi:peptide/nickel transport system substrate-binding protein